MIINFKTTKNLICTLLKTRVDLCFLNQIIRVFFESLTVSYWPYCVYISIALFDQLATVVVEAKFFEEDFLELVFKELNHFGVIAGFFRQIGGHSSRFVLFCSF